MARKADDLLADLDQLGSDEVDSQTTSKPPPSQAAAPTVAVVDDDPFSDIEKSLAAKPASSSRPTTPRLSSSTTSGGTKRAEHTPASSGPPSGRTSEDRLRSNNVRTSGEGRSYHQSFTPGDEQQRPQQGKAVEEKSSGGGWWGSVFSAATGAATAAVKQAETLAKELQRNEEAMRWADQVKNYSAGLQHLSTDIRSRALPTFTSLISHIAPPISAHERLQIHATHDILNYPSLDPIIYSTFSRVMAQVEGGDLLVIQRGSSTDYKGSVLGGGSSGWTDGPWWRDESSKRDLGIVTGLREGTRLVRVSAESFAREFFEATGGVEEAAKRATEALSESNPVRSSDIFLAVQAIQYEAEKDLFAGDGRSEKTDGDATQPQDDEVEALVCFAIYLYDPIHSLSFSTLSQSFPRRWASWLDAGTSGDGEGLPESILSIIAGGGVDPREWVAEWTEEVLSLGVGVVAQRYVATRMGVGDSGDGGGVGKAKAKAREEELIAEAAARGV